MKRILILTLGTCALVANASAETVWQQIGRAIETQANVAARQEARQEAIEYAEAQQAVAQAKAEHEMKIQLAYQTQAERNRRRDEAFAADARSNPFYHTDPIPEVGDLYDSEPMIRMYLHDSGYSEITDGQVTQICAYMKANHVRHVSELGQ